MQLAGNNDKLYSLSNRIEIVQAYPSLVPVFQYYSSAIRLYIFYVICYFGIVNLFNWLRRFEIKMKLFPYSFLRLFLKRHYHSYKPCTRYNCTRYIFLWFYMTALQTMKKKMVPVRPDEKRIQTRIRIPGRPVLALIPQSLMKKMMKKKMVCFCLFCFPFYWTCSKIFPY